MSESKQTTQAESQLTSSLADGVLELRFNRPEKKNAITKPMYGALLENMRRAADEEDIRVVLFRGTDDCFCAGNDISDLAAGFADASDASGEFMKLLMNPTKPLVAAVSGPAIGIGATLLMHCDLIYADDSAVFRTPFTHLGVCPEAGSSYTMPARLGYRKAAEMLLLSKKVDAAEALAMGLLNAVLPHEELYAHARAVALKLAALPSASVQLTKRLMRHTHGKESLAAFDREIEAFTELLESPAAQAAFAAFMEKK